MHLYERERPLEALRAGLAQAARREGRVVLVAGEAGIGKTSLVASFLNELPLGADVMVGACEALFTPRPLGPLRDIALQLEDPALRDVDAEGDRHAVFTAFLARLRSNAKPAIVVFEDVHWADEATLDLVKYLGRRIARLPALFVLTYRDDEVGPRHPLRSVIGELPAATTSRLVLDRLSEGAVRAMARNAGRVALPGELFAMTGGNPFFVSEVLAGTEGALPSTLRDAVLARTARLPAASRAALDLASLSPVPLELWCVRACGPGIDVALDDCVAQGMLTCVADSYAFRHELARLAILEALPAARRSELAGRLLRALESRGSHAELLSRLAHHAADAADADAVAKYAPAAGRMASALGAHREARLHFRHALAYAGALPAGDRARLLAAYAQECHGAGDMDEAIAARTSELALWRELGDTLRQGESLCRRMICLVGAGRNAEAGQVCREAIALLEPLPPGRELALAYRSQSALCMFERDNAEAVAWGEKAIALAQACGDDETVVAAGNAIGSALLLEGDQARGIAYLEDSLAKARSHGLDVHVANAYGNLGSACGEVHRFALAERYLSAGIAYANERDMDYTRDYQLAWLANAQLHLGRWSEAADSAQAVLQRPGMATICRIMALLALGRLRTRRGDPGADEALDEALALADRTCTLQRIGPVRAARAEAAWLRGDASRARAEALAAYPLALAKSHAWFAGELAYWQWKAGGLGEPPACAARPYRLHIEQRAALAASAWRELDCPYEAARALAEADDEASLLRALEVFDQLGAQPAAERTRLRLRELGTRSIPRGPRPVTRANAFGLTPRELEIVALLAQGLTNAAIAARLHRSEKTIDHHVSSVLAKLDVRTREAAAAAAASRGLVPK